jgi:K+ transporter
MNEVKIVVNQLYESIPIPIAIIIIIIILLWPEKTKRFHHKPHHATEVKEHTFYITDNNTKQRLKQTVIKVERLTLEKPLPLPKEAGYA